MKMRDVLIASDSVDIPNGNIHTLIDNRSSREGSIYYELLAIQISTSADAMVFVDLEWNDSNGNLQKTRRPQVAGYITGLTLSESRSQGHHIFEYTSKDDTSLIYGMKPEILPFPCPRGFALRVNNQSGSEIKFAYELIYARYHGAGLGGN